MKRVALAAFWHTRRLVILAVLGLAVVLLLARALVPFAEGLRGELATHLDELLGMRVEVGALTVRFEGWSPHLTLTDVTLRGRLSDQAEFSARELVLDLNLFATWGARKLRIEGLTLVGAELELRRDIEGGFSISGLQALGGGDDPGGLTFFLREGHFALTDSRLYWTDTFSGSPTIAVDIAKFLVVNRDEQHLLRLDAWLAADPRTRLSARGHLRGAAQDLSGWAGELYTRLDSQQDLLSQLQQQLSGGVALSLSGLRLETWSRIDAGRLVAVLAKLRADALSANRVATADQASRATPAPAPAAAQAQALTLDGLSALVQWSREGATTHLRVADLRAHGLGTHPLSIGLSLSPVAATSVPATDTTQATSAGKVPAADEQASGARGSRRLSGGLGEAELSVLQQLARLTMPELMAKLPPNLVQQPLAGRLERLVFALDLPAEEFTPTDWRIKAELDGLGVEQDQGWPGGRGLQLEVDAEPERGFARIGMREGTLDLRPRLAEPLAVERLDAQLGWRIEPSGELRLRVPDARLRTSDLGAELAAEVRLHSSASPDVDLHLQLRDADASAVGRYLPVRVLDPPLVAWLNRAVRGGRVTEGDFLLRGRLADFPFDEHQGRFVMDLQISDGTLDYSAPRPGVKPRPRWPALEGLNAEVRIVNRRLDISVDGGRFLDSALLGGSANIPNLWKPERIFIKARGQGPFADGRRVLLETPLEAQLGRLARAFEVDGKLGIALELGVPFRRGAEVDYQGELEWRSEASARLDLGEGREPIALRDIQGQLGFSNRGVEAQNIQARLGEQTISVDVKTQQPDAGQGAALTRVEARGQAPLQSLVESFPSPIWDLVAGDPDWQLAVSLSNQDFSSTSAPINLQLSSNLKGVSLKLPAPLGKGAQAEMPLRLSAQLVGQGLQRPALQLGPLKARLALRQAQGQPPGLRAVAVALNAEPPAPPQSREISLSGRLASLKLGPWIDWWKAHRTQFGQGREALPVRSSGIEIGRLNLGVLEFRDLTAKLAPRADGGTEVRFNARDNTGVIGLPPVGSAAPLRVELEHWRLESPDSVGLADAPVAQARPAGAGIDPRRLGPIDIRVERLAWNQTPLGRFRVRLRPNGAGVDFQELQLTGALINAQGQGSWQSDLAGGFRTAASVQMNSPNAGELLRRLGLYQGLDGSKAQISADLEWPGDPAAFGLARARGAVEVDFKAGRLLEVEPGVGRMLGFLNVAAIQRRLSLDFRDVVDEGFSFDQAKGRFVVADGLARIERFTLLSSTADIGISGTTNLVKETLEQTVTVTPKIGSGLALASALAGGPLVGAAVLLADKVTGGAVNRLTQYQYRITGPWREPKVEKLGLTVNDRIEQAGSATSSATGVRSAPTGDVPPGNARTGNAASRDALTRDVPTRDVPTRDVPEMH